MKSRLSIYSISTVSLIVALLLDSFGETSCLIASDSLVVHEWGTFTSLQDEQGRELTGINTDDEPVPAFVHNLNRYVLDGQVLSSSHWLYRQKGAPRVHPYVTMRLETPVIYFYPPKSWNGERTLHVSVHFRGGWLTQFYPAALPKTPGLESNNFEFGKLTGQTISRLEWRDLRVGTGGIGPRTDEQVWLTPRNVAAANVTSSDGESEKYLFYRGVGRIRSPIKAVMDRQAGQLTLHANFDEVLTEQQAAQIPAAWLVHVRKNGECAFRTLNGFRVSGDPSPALATTGYRFAPGDFQPDCLPRLMAAMHPALVADGLRADEASALLGTWKRSYFTSPGLRLLYLVPRVWTDHYLPLSISAEAQISRVMVGRLELISDEQQTLLEELVRTASSDGKWLEQIADSPARVRFLAGRTEFGELGVPIPPDFQTYLDLGRFRNALVVHQEKIEPTPNLTKFIETYQLQPFRVKE
jgi:hypothetical protein